MPLIFYFYAVYLTSTEFGPHNTYSTQVMLSGNNLNQKYHQVANYEIIDFHRSNTKPSKSKINVNCEYHSFVATGVANVGI